MRQILTTYTWNPGNTWEQVTTITPASNTVVPVIGANGTYFFNYMQV